jgi:hypothetical protein
MKKARPRAERGIKKGYDRNVVYDPEAVAAKKKRLEQANEALRLRINRASTEEIAKILGLPSRMQAWRLIQYALAEIPRENVEEYRLLLEAEMDADLVRLNVHLQRAVDPKDIARLIETKQRIRTARARLNGLNKPEQLEVRFRADKSQLDNLTPEELRRVASFDFSPLARAGEDGASRNGAAPSDGSGAHEVDPGGADPAH